MHDVSYSEIRFTSPRRDVPQRISDLSVKTKLEVESAGAGGTVGLQSVRLSVIRGGASDLKERPTRSEGSE